MRRPVRPRARPDAPTLVAGLGLVGLGVLLLLDGSGTLDLRFAVVGPVLCAVVGAVLLATGLSRRS